MYKGMHLGEGMMYRLHGLYDWGSLVVHMALVEIGAPFEFVILDPEQGDLTRPGYLALNPFGLVPALETPDGPLFETAAILLYLADRHNALVPAPSAPDRGAFLVWLAVVCQQLHPAVLQLIHPERMLGEGAQRAVADATHRRLLDICTKLEARAALGEWWFSAAPPSAPTSILTMYIAMLLRWAQSLPPYPEHALVLADFPALQGMIQALETRAPIARVLAREGLTAATANPLSAPLYEGS
jgi:glutathione S-transferase